MTNELTEEQQSELFRSIADKHIDLANSQMQDAELTLVTSGFMYGASRFSAFTVASGSKNLEEYEASMNDAIEHYTSLFRGMLEGNLESYKSAFEVVEEKPRYTHLMKEKK